MKKAVISLFVFIFSLFTFAPMAICQAPVADTIQSEPNVQDSREESVMPCLLHDEPDTLCQSRIAALQRENEALADQLKALQQKYNADSLLIAQFGNKLHNPRAFYYRAVMEWPFFDPYNPSNVEQSMMLADVLNIADKDSKIYNTYIDLLHNYKRYTDELVENVNQVIMQFDYPRFDADYELANFIKRLNDSDYYKVRGKGQLPNLCHIYYLDAKIADVKALFADPKKCNKKEFEKVRNYLLGR